MKTSLEKKINQHPSLRHASDLIDICSPLKQLNITYFAHVNIDNKSNFSAISNNPAFGEHYLKNEYFNVDIHLAKHNFIKDYVIWDDFERGGKSDLMHQEAATFGVKHTFTIIQKSEHGKDYYHFATQHDNNKINQHYLANLDLLKLFIAHFNNLINQDNILKKAYDLKFSINRDAEGYIITNPNIGIIPCENFINSLKINKFYLLNKKKLSHRELEILTWLHFGKSLHDIAKIINIAEVTVNKHIANIKSKLDCHSLFQLGEFYAKYLNLDDSIRKKFIATSLHDEFKNK